MSRMSRVAFGVKTATVLRGSERFRRRLAAEQVLPQERLVRLRETRAIAHARFAMSTTPFYRDFYSASGFTLQDLDDPAAFAELPIVEKSHVRDHFDAFRSDEADPSNSKISTTGGSTGEPLRLLRDLRTPTRAIEWRLFSWWGVHPSDDVATVSRQTRDEKDSLKHRLIWWPSRRFQLDAYRMDSARVASFLDEWNRVRPSLLIGYVGAIAELAKIVEQSGPAHRPVAVAVTAAPVAPAQRASIESAFGAPVYDHYRSAEIPWIAGECAAHSGLHVFADVRHVEVVGDDGRGVEPGVLGQVVATDFTNRVFPLIRYRLGDKTASIRGDCPCGVTLPRIEPVLGRVSEALRLPDGQLVAGESLTQTFAAAPGAVRQFQIHQLADYRVIVRCVAGSASDASVTIEAAVERIRGFVDGKVPVELEIVDEIKHDGGKIRYIKTDVPAVTA